MLVGAGIIAAFPVGKVPPVLPILRADLGLSLVAAGWILSSLNILGGIAGSATGAMADWLGHRRFIFFGLTAQAVGSLLGSLAQGFWLLLSTRLLEGMGYLIVAVSVPTLLIRSCRSENRNVVFGIWSSFMPIGTSTTMMLTPILVNLFGWRGLWQINTAIVITFGLCLLLAARNLFDPLVKKPGPASTLFQDIRLTMSSAGPVLLALCFSTYAFHFIIVIGFLPTLLIENDLLSQGLAAVLTAGVVAINVVGNLSGGWLLNRGLKRWYLIAVAGAAIGLCSIMIYSPVAPLLVRYLFCLLWCAAGGLIPVSTLSGVLLHAPKPDLVGTTNGLILQGSNIGLVIGSPAIAVVVTITGGWHSAPWLLVTSAAILVMLSLGVRKKELKYSINTR
jgi:MFS family permease